MPGVQLETSGPCVDWKVTGLGELKHVETVETLYVKTERKHLMPLVETLDTQHMRPLARLCIIVQGCAELPCLQVLWI